MAKLIDVIEHLGNQKAITRDSWNGHSLVIIGMDNAAWFYTSRTTYFNKTFWIPSLSDLRGDDWIALPISWDVDRDQFNNDIMTYFQELRNN